MINNKKQPPIGTMVSMDLPQITVELFALGFDFIFIDLEHGNVSETTIASIISTKRDGCKVLIRIPEITETAIKHALDLGSDGIIAPRLEHLDEIDILIDNSFYHPIGKRSVGFGPANKYGLKFKEYTENFKPLIFPQVESIKGLEIAESILSNQHITGTFIGPYDLSMSLGIPGQFDNPLFMDAVETVRSLCTKHNKSFGTFTPNAQAAAEEINKGTDMIIVGADGNLFLNAYLQIITALKGAQE